MRSSNLFFFPRSCIENLRYLNTLCTKIEIRLKFKVTGNECTSNSRSASYVKY